MFPPKVTCDKKEFIIWNNSTVDDLFGCIGYASSLGYIWVSNLSPKLLLHEFLHILGWKLGLAVGHPVGKLWHKLIEIIL